MWRSCCSAQAPRPLAVLGSSLRLRLPRVHDLLSRSLNPRPSLFFPCLVLPFFFQCSSLYCHTSHSLRMAPSLVKFALSFFFFSFFGSLTVRVTLELTNIGHVLTNSQSALPNNINSQLQKRALLIANNYTLPGNWQSYGCYLYTLF